MRVTFVQEKNEKIQDLIQVSLLCIMNKFDWRDYNGSRCIYKTILLLAIYILQ
jgi:hypothetical protein